jgi:putative hydrolase
VSDQPFGFGLPDDGRPGDDDSDQNPFGLTGGQPADLGAALQQLGQMLSTGGSGPVSWPAASDAARQAVIAAGDASCTVAEREQAQEALRLAELWLDPVTELPAAVHHADAWSRQDWVQQTLEQWKPYVEPLARRMAQASVDAVPEQMRSMAGPMLGMLQQMSGALFGMQAGQGLAALAQEVVSAADVGLPLATTGTAALVPLNVAAFADGLGLPDEEVRLYLALREVAHVRLFHHAPWLRSSIVGLVDDYARGINVDLSQIEQAVGGLDPSDPAALQDALGAGVFEPPTTDEQRAAQERLETVLALIEGWVDVVVDAAGGQHLPSAEALRETLRRRRATGGPAEATFASLVGLTLRPRRLREAATLWQWLSNQLGAAARDGVWNHPDLIPGASDLDDPGGFVERLAAGDQVWDLSSLDDAPPAPPEDPTAPSTG